jgi:hypothetical protein
VTATATKPVQGDEYAPSCDLVPGRIPHGPGWYLVSLANGYVEAGPWAEETHALLASLWMDDEARGVNPQPYEAVWSARGMIVGSRRRLGRKRNRKPC